MLLEKFKKIIKESNNIVFFGGAGVSTESNIPDFRSENGLYKAKDGKKYRPEEMLSHSFFVRHTEEFYDFYRTNMIYESAKPNKAHLAVAELEGLGKLKTVITQNIDGLHQEAGSKNVLELHGSIHRNFCMNCNASYALGYIIGSKTIIPMCEKCGGILKPDVVLYEENLNTEVLNSAIEYINNAEVLIVGGTSLVVYPAAGLISYYKGDKLVLINKESTSYDYKANLIFNESIGEVLNNIL